MAANIINIKSYSPKSSDVFFFDNNIWMHLFCPIGNFNQSRQKVYSSFLQSVQTSRATIFISSLVLSEFTNSYLRLDFAQWKNTTKNYSADYKKDYVASSQYVTTVNEIKIHLNRIMRFCEKSSDNFNAININDVFSHIQSIDFNDSYYLELSRLDNWKIVTDDKDFTNYTNHNLDVITFVN
jgi:predicted nucleic acid-binding protein